MSSLLSLTGSVGDVRQIASYPHQPLLVAQCALCPCDDDLCVRLHFQKTRPNRAALGQLDLRRFETILESAHQDGEDKTDRILESSDAADDQGEKVVEDTKKNKEKEESHATKQGISLV